MKYLILLILTAALSASAQITLITPNPTNIVNLRDCTGVVPQQGYNYTKSRADGWGWATNSQPLQATGCVSGAVVHYVGKNGDTGCGTNWVRINWPAPSPTYRFSQSFPGTPVTPPNKATLTLVGFNP